MKAPQSVQYHRNQLPEVALLPEQVLAKWGAWIQAVNFYREHFNVVTFHAIAVHESQTAFSEPKIACSMAYVRSNFAFIPYSIKKWETTGISLQESMDILENAEVKLNAVQRETGEKVYRKFQAVLKMNPGYSTSMSVHKILDREDTDPPKDISPGKCHLLKFTTVTSCDVERSFSTYKRILSDRRLSMTSENMEKCPRFTVYRNKHIMYYCSFIILTVSQF
jgi:hypothetical protein